MDALQFIAELVKALAWPAVICILIVFLRPHFGQILGLIRTVKFKEFEMTFGETDSHASRALETFWMPDGKRPNPENQARLTGWMRDNGLDGVSVTTFLNAGPLDAARRRAMVDLGLEQHGNGGQSGAEG